MTKQIARYVETSMNKIFLALSLLLGACATTPRNCTTPEAYFGKYGDVIECYDYRTKDTGDSITACYVEGPGGQVYRKRLPTRSCWSR